MDGWLPPHQPHFQVSNTHLIIPKFLRQPTAMSETATSNATQASSSQQVSFSGGASSVPGGVTGTASLGVPVYTSPSGNASVGVGGCTDFSPSGFSNAGVGVGFTIRF